MLFTPLGGAHLAIVAAGPAAFAATSAWVGGALIVGMTAGDIPVMTGSPDQGFEGYRFVAHQRLEFVPNTEY